MLIKMTTNLFRASRMNMVILPGQDETVELPDAGALALVATGHAEQVEAEVAELREVRPDPTPEVRPAPAVERRGPGRPKRNS